MTTIPLCTNCGRILTKTQIGYRCWPCTICRNCSQPLTKTQDGFKCLRCRYCKQCHTALVRTEQDYVCPRCGICHQVLEHDYESNLTFNERIQLDTQHVTNYNSLQVSTGAPPSYAGLGGLLEGVPGDLVRVAVGEEETLVTQYMGQVWATVRSVPDLEGFDEQCLRKIAGLTMDYIQQIYKNSNLSHMTIPKNKQILVVSALIFALQSQQAVVGVHESHVIESCWDRQGDFAKYRNRVFDYCANLKLGSIVPGEALIDERAHRKNIFQRWCSKFDLAYGDRRVVYELLDTCVTNVWLGGRQFEYCMACVFKHLYYDGCRRQGQQPVVTTKLSLEDLKFLVKDVLGVQWKTLKRGSEIISKCHDEVGVVVKSAGEGG